MRRILIVGGGYTGLYTAWGLERRLRPGEAEVTIVDPRPYMTYQPFLPEVAAGSIEPRHAAVSLRRHLRRTRVVDGMVTRIEHARRVAIVQPTGGEPYELPYDEVVVSAGAVTRTFPIPGLIRNAIGVKTVAEAVAIRDRLLTDLDRAAGLPAGAERARLLTVTVVGGGFSGVEVFAELLDLATDVLRRYPEVQRSELRFHLVEAMGRILPEVDERTGAWVVDHLRGRGARVHLDTQLTSAEDGHIVLSDGDEFDAGLIVWTAGNATNPVVANRTDLPIGPRGLVAVRADLRVVDDGRVVPGAWAAGDDAAVPDLAARRSGALTVPNAQHAVRQAKLLARNIAAALHGRPTKDYLHHPLGVVATLGLWQGVFQYRRLVIRGPLAWLMHRGYHLLAVPSWERKIRVLAVWVTGLLLGRDIVSLVDVQHPHRFFSTGGRPAEPPTRQDLVDA